MRYRVTKLQDGRTFGTTEVVAEQDGKVISAAVLSMHADEDGLHRSDAPPAVGPPEDAAARRPRHGAVGDAPRRRRRPRRPRPPGRRSSTGGCKTAPVGDEPLACTRRCSPTPPTSRSSAPPSGPFDGVSQADSTITLHTAVTSHTLWFHQPFRVDDWLLLTQHSPVVANGRSFGRGDVYAGDELVASFAQEAMVRQIEPPGADR